MTELNESLKRYVPLNYIKTAADASKTCENERRTLLEQVNSTNFINSESEPT